MKKNKIIKNQEKINKRLVRWIRKLEQEVMDLEIMLEDETRKKNVAEALLDYTSDKLGEVEQKLEEIENVIGKKLEVEDDEE